MAISVRKPVCFVLIPFGVKMHPDSGFSIDFDAIYEGSIWPALRNAGMDPVRLDQDMASLQQSSVQRRLLEAEFAVADVTIRDPAILFLLGSRAERMPGTTVVLAAHGSQTQLSALPAIRLLLYDLDEGYWLSSRESVRLRKMLTEALSELRSSLPATALRQESTAAGEQSLRGAAMAQAIENARHKRDLTELQRLQAELSHEQPDSALLLNIFQAYVTLGAWESLFGLYQALPPEMQKLARVRQQAGLALNRMGRRNEAVAMLSGLLSEQGPDSETLGILGRIYKDLWFESKDPAALDRAIEWYEKGFDANRRDAYPGINAVTLLEIRGDPGSQQTKERLLPFVLAAVQDQIKLSRSPNYWDHATLLELAVLAGDEDQAWRSMNAARGSNAEDWQAETTADNLALIREARAKRGIEQPWLNQILTELHSQPKR
jgi:hypothetical protein